MSSTIDYNNLKRIYFIGIGGIGMSALARYFHFNNVVVSGYDRTETALTKQLQQEGIAIHFTDDIALADLNADLIIYTPAIPKDHKEYNYFLENGYPIRKRAQVLGELSASKFTIAIAGSHGKTTVSSMIAWILKHSGYDCTAFLGGICVNFNSNFVAGKNEVMVIEADEFDRSFLQLHPDIAVITAVDSDHLEIYGTQQELEKTFTEFAHQVTEKGKVVLKSSLPILKNIQREKFSYSINDTAANLFVADYKITLSGSQVTLNNGMQYKLIYPGIHNIENSVAASGVALLLGIEKNKIISALNVFNGVHRRFEIMYQNDTTVFIDDYAHHPEEIAMFLKSVRAIYAGKKITAIFQPHLFTRTRDLAEGFSASLSIADEVVLLPIYPARELPIEGVSSAMIYNHIHSPSRHIMEKEDLLEFIQTHPLEIVCTIGAGDIDKLVEPIVNTLKQKHPQL